MQGRLNRKIHSPSGQVPNNWIIHRISFQVNSLPVLYLIGNISYDKTFLPRLYYIFSNVLPFGMEKLRLRS